MKVDVYQYLLGKVSTIMNLLWNSYEGINIYQVRYLRNTKKALKDAEMYQYLLGKVSTKKLPRRGHTSRVSISIR